MRTLENVHYQYRNGMLTAEDWDSYRMNLKQHTQVPAWKEYWKTDRMIYTAAFKNEVDRVIAELEHEPTVTPDSVVHGYRDGAQHPD